MNRIHSIEEIKALQGALHIALGVFDGVHIGHQAVIKSVVAAAQKSGGVAAVLTFDPHPIRVLAPHVAPTSILASLQHKEDLLASLGVEVLIVIPFTEEFALVDAGVFLTNLNDCCVDLQTLAMGEDWKFGNQRGGNVAMLRSFSNEHSIEVMAMGAVMLDGERVSSTRIRQAIRDGNIDSASAMLGRDYSVLGTVVKGKQLGRELGFPTANLRVHNEQLPPDGVWAVDVTLEDGSVVRGAGNLGVRPTVDDKKPQRLLEIHLLDYQGDLYGALVVVRFLKRVRAEQKFDSLDALKAQIGHDVKLCRAVAAI